MSKSGGLSRDSGWQIGVRRAIALSADRAWELVTSETGVRAWLGQLTDPPLGAQEEYQLADGTSGEVRVYSSDSHVRVTRNPGDWEDASTVRVWVIPKGNQSVIAFQEVHLPSQEDRIDRREHYRAALDRLEEMIDSDQASQR